MIFPIQEEWSRAHHLRLMRKLRSSSQVKDFDLAYEGRSSKGTVLDSFGSSGKGSVLQPEVKLTSMWASGEVMDGFMGWVLWAGDWERECECAYILVGIVVLEGGGCDSGRSALIRTVVKKGKLLLEK